MIYVDEISEALVRAGIPASLTFLFDEDYELVKPTWITHDLREAFEKALFGAGITAREGQFDCNKIAKFCTVVADLSWYKTKKSEAVLAFGILVIGSTMHTYCVAVHMNEKDSLYVAVYDPTPQIPEGWPVTDSTTMREVTLTKEDYQSCLGCIFI